MKTALLKQDRTRWPTALCALAFPVLLVPATIVFATSKASAQFSDVEMGAGKGGRGGAVDGSPGKEGQNGNDGTGGKGGDGYSQQASQILPGGAGGTPGQTLTYTQTINTSLQGNVGEDGKSLTDNEVFSAMSPGGGGGGGTGLILSGINPDVTVGDLNTGFFLTGGNGGNGGSNITVDSTAGDGGGGGAGAYVIDSSLRNRGTIIGGTGGKGGDSFAFLGKGGDGGAGVILADGANLTNDGGKITGGNGGDAGDYLTGPPFVSASGGGTGGVGVYMHSNSTLNNSIGTIQGGQSVNTLIDFENYAIFAEGNGNTIINTGNVISGSNEENSKAIFIKGNDNYLQLSDGSKITGKVSAEGERNYLEYYVYVSETLNPGQFLGFSSYNKTGPGRLTLTDATDEVTPWTVSAGILAIENDHSLGNASGSLTLIDGTLEILDDNFDVEVEISRPIRIEKLNNLKTDADVIIHSEITGTGTLVKMGSGVLTLTNDNSYSGDTLILDGVLELIDGGTLSSGIITIADGASLDIDFHGIYNLNPSIKGNGTLNFLGTTEAIIKSNNNDFQGFINIEPKASLNIGGDIGGTIINHGFLIGDGNVGSVVNHGTLIPGGENSSSLDIEGNYTGEKGSVIQIYGRLGDDTSEITQIAIDGNTEGQSNLHVENIEGKGADTQKGIEVISVGGQSDAVFTLIGDYELSPGIPVVIAGAHSYFLEKGSASDASDGNWYLRSHVEQMVCPSPEPEQPAQPCIPSCPLPEPGQPAQPCLPTCSVTEPEACSPTGEIYQPGVPLYTGYGQFVSSLNTVSTMSQRVGNRYWNGVSGRQIAEGDGPGLDAIPDPNNPHILTEAGLIWGRIDAAHSQVQLYNSTLNSGYSSDQWNIRAGIDQQLKEYAASRVIGSVWLEYGSAKADLASYFGSGDIKVNSYSLGTAITWLHENGFYLDSQARFSWTRSDITSSTLNRALVSGAKGDGLAFSLEAGQRLALNDIWSWTPQAQLTWSQTALDNFTDPYEAEVSFDDFKNLTARAGLTLQYANTWQDRNGYTRRGQIYALANFYRELLGQSPSIIISQEKLKPGNADRNWGEIGLGGTYAFHNGKYALFGETALASGLDDVQNSYTIRGNVGTRVRW
ncbi:autotransporter family protein [Ochrobactrum soli]|uniref:Autotransporter outer membrane beta-barrel domain-containing protein n=1 Tax=Ochrobactrum soli TaxID=2448455 RepID=A0A849KCU6_9HYPH|nr:autotransporter outer membrane beta-barrel domain-containing protein [[Ochrobactrum] soli]NNU59241.1 autotransporter outer membrane beta-barrel domain-containing protein [[Ochrobactrum] soli]